MADEQLKTWKGDTVTPIEKDRPLYAGDRVIIRFKWFGTTTIKSVQLAIIDARLEGRSDFRVRTYQDQGDFLDCEVEVLQSAPADSEQVQVNPGSGVTQASLVTAGVVAVSVAVIAVAFTTATYFLLLHSQYMRKSDLVLKGVLPPSVLDPATGQAASGFKAFGYAALIGVCGYIVLSILRR